MEVLLGVGGTPLSYHALEETVERAREAGDALTVALFDDEEADDDRDAVEQRVRDALAAADLEADLRRIDGDPGAQLVAIADRESFDRIVLGSGRRSTLGKIQLGPVAEFVLLNSQTAVTLVR